jgi:putative hemolysin
MNSEILLFAFLLLVSSTFSGSEMALFSLSDAKIRSLVDQRRKNAKTLQEIRSLINTGATAFATVVATEAFGSRGLGIATGVMTIVILYVGEIIPKTIAQKYNVALSLAVAPLMKVTMFLLTPVLWVVNGITHAFQKSFGLQQMGLNISEDDVRAMISLGHEEGSLEKGEKEMIERVFLLNDITAEDVMTPEDYMVGFDSDAKISDVLPLIQESAYSRYPVYHPETGDVEGIVYIKDVFNYLANERDADSLEVPVQRLVKPASFVPGTMHIDDLLKFFQKKHQHIAIVVDEFGTVLGLVTLEDLLEEIVGEIIDETDVDSDLIQRVDKYSILLDPRITIGKVNTFFNSTLKGSRHKTVGWLLLREFGHIPKKGDSKEISGYKFVIEDADERRMKRVLMVKTPEVKQPPQ